ncbi:MAG: undecaprenyl-diphosphate phosphatase [Thermovirgaceae bacterium]|nr:undecaprenyl-diphosphate phosphatase [Thermovirgaceae bacterium]
MFQCAVLGLLQGITEFLPVSSSGHLVIAQSLLGWQDPAIAFDVMLHLATMAATMVYFQREIFDVAAAWFGGLFSPARRDLPGWMYGWGVVAGTLVTVAVVLMTRPLIHLFFGSTLFVGFALMITGLALFYGRTIPRGRLSVTPSSGIKVGLAQGVAAFPGISRSGFTIIAGLRSGLAPAEAFSFSFLLSLPATLGAAILEIAGSGNRVGLLSSLPQGWWAGMILAFVSGLLALSILHRVVVGGRWGIFAAYCFAAGGLVLALHYMGG